MAIDMTPTAERIEATTAPVEVRDVERTTCCVVGGGPAGVTLAYMLARRGVAVMLLEEHADFDRDFRGDTLNPSVLEIMDELGLAEQVHKLPHTKIHSLAPGEAGPIPAMDLRNFKTRFPYVMLVQQSLFLDLMIDAAKQQPSFRLVTGARVERLIEENGAVVGVLYRGADGWHEVRAALTVGSDGRYSRLRGLAGLEPIRQSPPLDVLWFRLPHPPENENQGMLTRMGPGYVFVIFDRGAYFQVAYSIPKRSYQQLREVGLPALRQTIAERVPELAPYADQLQDWKQVILLSVQANRLPRWYRAGLLMIGDAAHTMAPIAGVGINMAIQDSVAAANHLVGPLKDGHLQLKHLAAVQRQRELPVRIIQAIQGLIQKQIIAPALDPNKPPAAMPAPVKMAFRIPLLRDTIGRIIIFGPWPAHVKN
jgi:2-polyprenyl-6-methoxyphenol hydroxylase-like FAD-dependent oxidoreductase